MAGFFGGLGYGKRAVPSPGADLRTWAALLSSWLATEFGNVERSTRLASNRTVTTNTTVLATDGLILCDTTSNTITVSFPTPLAKTKDWVVVIKRTSAGANAVTISGTIDGVVNPTLAAQYNAMTIWSDGTVLRKIASV